MFHRLVAIPQEEYMQLSRIQQISQPATHQFRNLERQFNEQEHVADPYRRLMMQSETLDEMKGLKERMREDITAATPKPYRKRAQSLFQSMQPFLRFNERGEIYNANQQLIPGSRLEDLIQHAVRDRRRDMTPTGWSDFRSLLETHNAPRMTLNRNTLEEMSKGEVKSRNSPPPPPPSTKRIKAEKKDEDEKYAIAMQRPKRNRKSPSKYSKDFGFLKYY